MQGSPMGSQRRAQDSGLRMGPRCHHGRTLRLGNTAARQPADPRTQRGRPARPAALPAARPARSRYPRHPTPSPQQPVPHRKVIYIFNIRSMRTHTVNCVLFSFIQLNVGNHEKFSMARQGEVSRHLHTTALLKSTGSFMCKNLEMLILYSKTNTTWSKHCSAWNALQEFSSYSNTDTWPVDIHTARKFVVWALQHKHLKPDTVKAYLSSIKLAHTLGEIECKNFTTDGIIKMALTGARNINFLQNTAIRDRPPMTLSSLQILGHELAHTDWKVFSKQVVWTACLISFFTSCRMGELLSVNTNSYDKNTTLLWKHVNLWTDYATVYIPFTKVKGLQGHVIDIFSFKLDSCCPFSALKSLKNMSIENNSYCENKPVFSFESGKLLTVNKLNEILELLLRHVCIAGLKYSCHSFRAAIPTLISNFPDKSYTADIMDWGEWDTTSYRLYAKSDVGRKKFLFHKISNLFNIV